MLLWILATLTMGFGHVESIFCRYRGLCTVLVHLQCYQLGIGYLYHYQVCTQSCAMLQLEEEFFWSWYIMHHKPNAFRHRNIFCASVAAFTALVVKITTGFNKLRGKLTFSKSKDMGSYRFGTNPAPVPPS